MADATIEIRSATIDEIPQTMSCLVAAFLTDPIGRFACPTPHLYLEGAGAMMLAFIEKAFEHGAAYVTTDFSGAACWLPPGVRADPEEVAPTVEAATVPEHLGDLVATFEEMEGFHPAEPHWYLPLIGVDPHAQGRGLGAALMRHALARCDEEGATAYLESSNPRNISLYRRHGFEPIGEVQVGAGPLVTPMLRPAVK